MVELCWTSELALDSLQCMSLLNSAVAKLSRFVLIIFFFVYIFPFCTQSVVCYEATLVVFFEGLFSLGRSGLFQVVFYCFWNESFTFFNRSRKALVDSKTFRVRSMLSWCSAGGASCITLCQPIKRIVYKWVTLAVSCQIMVLCSYVPINLVLCILLCVKIIVQLCAFIGLLADTFVCWGLFCWSESDFYVAIGNSNCGRGYTCL